MSVADELMLAISIGPGSLDLGIRARATALEPRQIDHTAEIASFDLPIETTRDHRRCAHRTRRPLTGWASLTDAERRVAELVSLGLTNREIGHQMFLSRHTVDDHLRHIFAKLGINTRVQLERYERVWSMRSGS
jgi:DNA-binding CsgD family transcriptional regulator